MYTAFLPVGNRCVPTRLRAALFQIVLAACIALLSIATPSQSTAQTFATIGTGTIANGTSEYPAPYGKYYNGAKHQMLILASELTAAGASAGYINSIGFNVSAPNGADAHPGFTVRMKQTTVTALSATWDELGWTTVYSAPNYVPVTGWNTHNFMTEFQWDGASNVMVEVCFNNYPFGFSSNAGTYYTTTSFVSVNYFRSDSDALLCTPGRGSTGTSSNRPNMRFTFRQANDATLLDVASPASGFTPGVQNVSVVLRNQGTNNLTSVQIPWSVNGIAQTAYNWTGTLTPGQSTVVQIGTYNFGANTGYDLVASINNPNNSTDGNPLNNTLQKSVGAGLLGTVVIGATPSDFTTMTAAANYLNNYGIRGSVVFDIKNGTYAEQFTLLPIPGTGSGRTVTFQAQSGNAADVVLSYSGTTTAPQINSLARLDGADNVVFKNLTFTAAATGTYGVLIRLMNGADNNTITNCVFNGKVTTSTGTDYTPILSNSSAVGVLNNQNTTITNNTFLNGSYGIYYYGATAGDLGKGLRIENNTFNSQYYMGIYLNQLDAPQVNSNSLIVNTAYSTFYGINMNLCQNAFSVQKNRIGGNRPTYGVYISNSTASPQSRSLVANNFIQSGLAGNATTSYGIYLSITNGLNVFHNSINVAGTSTSNRAFYLSGGDVVSMNNIYYASSGHAIYYVPPGMTSSDYNVYYSTGTRIGYYNTTDRNTLADWQSASGLDAHSIVADPAFISATDLHTSSAAINGRGIGVGVATDIDGAVRNTSAPDPGADEFSLSGVDAAIQWNGPVAPIASGNTTISVKVLNVRATPITSLRLSYSDGTTTVNQDFTGLNIQSDGSQVVNFTTSYNLQTPVVLTATIIQVNGAADGDNANNTASTSVRPALSGVYSVGSAGANFPTLSDALTVLDAAGVSGAVTFNVASGTYNMQVMLKPFAGADAARTVTFQAASGNAADVVIQPTATTVTDKYTVRFAANAQYYNLNNLSLLAPSSGSYGSVVEMANNVRNVAIRNSVINAQTFTTSSEFRGISVQATGQYQENITIENNTIAGGYYSIYLVGFSDLPSNNIRIANNTIRDFYFYGVYLYGVGNSTVTGNDITRPNRTDVSSYYGVTLASFTKNVVVEKNRFHRVSPSVLSITVYGVFASAADATVGQENIVKNNLFYDLGTLGTLYTVYNSSSDGFFAYNNTITLDDISSASTAQTVGIVQALSATNVQFKNNIVSITRGGTGLKIGVWLNDVTSQVASDNNLMFVNGAGGANYQGGFGGTVYVFLSGYQAASGRDLRSVNADPLFLGANDYRIPYNSPAAKFNGVVLAKVTDDFTGAVRSTQFADIGAYSSPASLNTVGSAVFGNIGKLQTRTVTVYNTSGSTPVMVSSLALGGANPSNFKAFLGGTTTPVPSTLTITPNGSVSIDVQFGVQGTSGTGAKSAVFTFTNNGAQPSFTIPVSGYYAGITAMDGSTNLLLPGAKLDVGGILVGGTPRSKDFTLAPDITGLATPLDITSYALSGVDASLFSVSTVPSSITGQVIVSITLNSVGATPGTKSAMLTLNHTGANGPTTTIAIEGKVGKPILGVPTLVEAPFVVLGQTYSSPYENVALIPLTRAGLVDVDMNQNPALTGSGASAMEIVGNGGKLFLRGKFGPGGTVVIGGDGNIANIVNWASPSVSTPIKVTETQPWFIVVRLKQPSGSTVMGSYSADLLLADGSGKGMSSAENVVATVVLGKVISDPSKLPMYPMQIAYGSIPVNTSFGKTLTLRNQSGVAGMATLTITGTSYTFANGMRSTMVMLPADNSPVAMEVFFSPTGSGAANGVVTASGVISGTVALSGAGQAANPGNIVVMVDGQVPGSIVNFGSVAVGQTGSKTITVINNNIGPVTISSIGRSGNNATQFAVVEPATWTVPGNGGSVSFVAKFVPTSLSNPQKDAAITIYNSTGVPKSLNVRGMAVNAGGAALNVSLSPSNYNFGNQTGTYSFVLSNTGGSAITVSGALILGSSNFTVVDAASSFPRTVSAGGTTTVTVMFNGTMGANGLRSGSLVVITPSVSPYPTSTLVGMVGTSILGSGSVSSQTEPVSVRSLAYPNPFAGETAVRYTLQQGGNVRMVIYDQRGREVFRSELGNRTAGEHREQIDLRSETSGEYFYRIEAGIEVFEGVLVLRK